MTTHRTRQTKAPKKGRLPARSAGNRTFSISCTLDELARIDRRAESLGITRTDYLLALTRLDYVNHQEFVLVTKDQLVTVDRKSK